VTDRATSIDPTQGTRGVEAALESVVDAVLVIDQSGVVIFANGSAEQLFGYPQTELVGQSVELLVPAPLRARHREHVRHYAARPSARPMGVVSALSAVRKDGTEVPVEISLAPLVTADGTLTTVVARDARPALEHDARREAELRVALERELDASNHRFRGAFDRAPIGMALVEVRPERPATVIRANTALAEMVGVPASQLVGCAAADLADEGQDTLPLGWPRLPAGSPDQVRAAELRLRRPDGGHRWVSMSSTVVHDADGRPDFLITHLVDVTERRLAEAAMAERTERDSRIATVLQAGLMPYVPRVVGPVRAASRYRPAGHGETVGGDWSDVLALPDGRIGLVVGDVAGHGIESAATMARLRTAVRMLATSGVSPAGVMRRLNDLMHETELSSDIDLATLVHAQLDPATGTLRYCSAGHLPLLLFTEAEVGPGGFLHRPVSPVPAVGGPPIGVVSGLRYSEQAVRLEPGSTLVGFTDGLIERRTSGLDASLLRLLDELGSLPADRTTDVEALADAVLELSPGESAGDDIAVIVFSFDPGPGTPSPSLSADQGAVPAHPPAHAPGRHERLGGQLLDLSEVAVRPPDRWA
jgi:PAS domain S-box-containing protein